MCRRVSELGGDYPVAIGMPRNAWLVRQLGGELVALKGMRASCLELEGDQVARREIAARIAAVSAQLEEELTASFNEATWYLRGQAHDERDARAVARLVSRLAEETFPDAPVIHSELVNREKPSSNSQGRSAAPPRHGQSGGPRVCRHRRLSGRTRALQHRAGGGGSSRPKRRPARLQGAERAQRRGPVLHADVGKATQLLQATDGPVPLSLLYAVWMVPPFGIRRGLLPILAMGFIVAHESSVSVYAEETFQPDINDFVADRLLQAERLISLRFVDRRAEDDRLMQELAKAVGEITGKAPAVEPLAIARALVEFAFRLPSWTRRTSALSKAA